MIPQAAGHSWFSLRKSLAGLSSQHGPHLLRTNPGFSGKAETPRAFKGVYLLFPGIRLSPCAFSEVPLSSCCPEPGRAQVAFPAHRNRGAAEPGYYSLSLPGLLFHN